MPRNYTFALSVVFINVLRIRLRFSLRNSVFSVLSAFVFATAAAQTPMGSVATHDALVTGGLEVHGEQASLLSNASITAYDHAAHIALARGGEALVCATSQFHLLHSGPGASLLFGLDRGAVELHSPTQPQDVILTPDIRFTIDTPGTLDLRLRVTRDGDTCVENTGPTAPTLLLSASFADATYRLLPGQHVLFEHGNLREVVDNERSPCGCPTTAVPSPAEAAHPFPAADSVGLAPVTPPTNATPPGEKHTQIATTFTYDAAHPDAPPPPSTVPLPTPPPAATTTTAPPPAPPTPHDLVHAIGGFFHRLFHGKPN